MNIGRLLSILLVFGVEAFVKPVLPITLRHAELLTHETFIKCRLWARMHLFWFSRGTWFMGGSGTDTQISEGLSQAST